MQKKDFKYLFFFTITLVSCFLVFPSITKAGVVVKPLNNLGLAAYWSFNEGSGLVAEDSSGSGNDLTLSNMDSTTSHIVGQVSSKAVALDGVNDTLFRSSSTGIQSSAFTFSGWVNCHEAYCYVVRFGNRVSNRGWAIGVASEVTFSPTGTGGSVSTSGANISQGVWYHIAVTYTTSNVNIYVNGVSRYSGNTGDIVFDGSKLLNFGSDYDTGYSPPSNNSETQIDYDEVRIYDRVLSGGEITAHYNNSSVLFGSTLKQSSNKNLVGYWSFEDAGGAKATDFSGNGNTGTLTNMDANTDWVDGRVGKALDFDGSNDYVSIPASSNNNFSGQFTISLWVKTTDSGNKLILDKRGAGWSTGDFGINLGNLATGVVSFNFNNGSTQYLNSATSIIDGQWHHVVVNRNGSSLLTIYIDGVAKAINSSGTSFSNNDPIILGRSGDGGGYMDGSLDEVRIYNTALSAIEIQNLYQSSKKTTLQAPQNDKITDGLVGYWTFNGKDLTTTTATDVSGNGNHGTLTNGPVPAQGKVGQALKLDGSNDYVTIGDSGSLDMSGSISGSLWLYRKTDSAATVTLIEKGKPGSQPRNYTFELFNSYLYFGGYSSGYFDNVSSVLVPTNEWVHVVFVFDDIANTLKFYQNGVEVYSGSQTRSLVTNSYSMRLGSNTYSFLEGRIDEVRLYNRALTATEIMKLYNLGR